MMYVDGPILLSVTDLEPEIWVPSSESDDIRVVSAGRTQRQQARKNRVAIHRIEWDRKHPNHLWFSCSCVNGNLHDQS
jgi:hypothetical protein